MRRARRFLICRIANDRMVFKKPDLPPGVVMRETILARLNAIEYEHSVRIVYACESGSRAWGFASPDSDFDVRFLYVHERDWYLAFDVERRRDVIELPCVEEIDAAGWDVRKALYLFTRTNGALLEWLHSPTVYLERGTLASALRALANRRFDARALCYHYAHMARGNARDALARGPVRLKKYLYVLRPLLAIRYIESRGALPPVAFDALVEAVAPQQTHEAIAELLAVKRRAPESEYGLRSPVLERFIEAELARHEAGFRGAGRPDLQSREAVRDELNGIFRKVLAEAPT